MSRPVLTLLLAALLALAAAPAHAQVDDVAPLSQDPPVALEREEGDDEAATEDDTSEDGAAAAELPDTGTDPVVVLLLGMAFVSGGAGLRLRLGGSA